MFVVFAGEETSVDRYERGFVLGSSRWSRRGSVNLNKEEQERTRMNEAREDFWKRC